MTNIFEDFQFQIFLKFKILIKVKDYYLGQTTYVTPYMFISNSLLLFSFCIKIKGRQI